MAGVVCCRVGVAGLGWGLFAHVPKFREVGLSITALYSRDLAKANSLATENGVAHAFCSIDEMVQSDDVDLIAISLPSHLRKEAVLAAARGGKHVLTQPTPTALSVADAEAMLAAAKDAGIQHFMDLELRWVPGLRRIRALLQGEEGPLLYQARSLNFQTVVNLGFLRSKLTTPDDISWKHDADKGGGVWAAFGPHFVDLARFLLADEVRRIRGKKTSFADDTEKHILKAAGVPRPADAVAYAELEMERGVVVTINLIGRSDGSAQENRMVLDCFNEKSFTFNFLTSDMELVTKQSTADKRILESMIGGGTAFTQVGEPKLGEAIKARLCEACEQRDHSDLATFEDGLKLQLVTEALDRSSMQNGDWQDVRILQAYSKNFQHESILVHEETMGA